MDYASLEPGQTISEQSYRLDAETVAKYLRAIGDEAGPITDAEGETLVPPMAIAAFGLRGVVMDLAIPGGTLHTGQEIEFTGAVHVGETLVCRATILQNSVRRDMRFMVVEMAIEDSNSRAVMKGKSTLVLPT